MQIQRLNFLLCLVAAATSLLPAASADGGQRLTETRHAAPHAYQHDDGADSFLSKHRLSNPSLINKVPHSQLKPEGHPVTALHSHTLSPKPRPNSPSEYLGIITFTCLLIGMGGWGIYHLASLHEDFEEAHGTVDDLDWEFLAYVKYIFGHWLASHKNASIKLLAIITSMILVLGAFLYWLLVPGATIWHSAWLTYLWMLAPSGGGTERTVRGAFCGGVISICGLMLFALMLTLLNDVFQKYMDKLRAGNEEVMEVGHVVIIGLTKTTIHLLHELCEAYALSGGVPIVILLGGIAKNDMQHMIEEAHVPMRGSKVILRAGYAQYETDLGRAGVNACSSVIIMADHRKDKEVRDAFVLQALLVLRSKGWPRDGHILVECSLLKNKPCLEKIGGDCTSLVITDRWLARLFLQVSQQQHLGLIIEKVFSFEGDSMCIEPVPDYLVGQPFAEAAWHFPHAIPIGTITGKADSVLGHEERILEKGQDLILLAGNDLQSRRPQAEKFCKAEQLVEARAKPLVPRHLGDEVETIIIVGWGSLIGVMMVQIDIEVKAGTKVVIVAPTPIPERKKFLDRTERRWQHELVNVRIEHIEGMLGSPTVWDRLPMPLEEASRIFILADVSANDLRHADACTIASVVQIRHILAGRKVTKDIPIVPEIRDPRTEHLCKICNISSYVDSSGMPVQVLAAVSVQPRLRVALRDMVGDDSEVGFSIRKLEHYVPPWKTLPTRLSFMQAYAIVSQTGDVLVGWSWPDHSELATTEFTEAMLDYTGDSKPLQWELNPPDKTKERAWGKHDNLCILGSH